MSDRPAPISEVDNAKLMLLGVYDARVMYSDDYPGRYYMEKTGFRTPKLRTLEGRLLYFDTMNELFKILAGNNYKWGQ